VIQSQGERNIGIANIINQRQFNCIMPEGQFESRWLPVSTTDDVDKYPRMGVFCFRLWRCDNTCIVAQVYLPNMIFNSNQRNEIIVSIGQMTEKQKRLLSIQEVTQCDVRSGKFYLPMPRVNIAH
jgi:hypothetical protein